MQLAFFERMIIVQSDFAPSHSIYPCLIRHSSLSRLPSTEPTKNESLSLARCSPHFMTASMILMRVFFISQKKLPIFDFLLLQLGGKYVSFSKLKKNTDTFSRVSSMPTIQILRSQKIHSLFMQIKTFRSNMEASITSMNIHSSSMSA